MVYEATITFTGINFTKKARNVGFIMNNNLSFSAHINEVCKIATQKSQKNYVDYPRYSSYENINFSFIG